MYPEDTSRLDLALDVALGFVNAGKRIPDDLADELRDAARESLGEPEPNEARIGLAAMKLAPDLETYAALMRGEKVPMRRLDQRYLYLLGRWPKSSTGSARMT